MVCTHIRLHFSVSKIKKICLHLRLVITGDKYLPCMALNLLSKFVENCAWQILRGLKCARVHFWREFKPLWLGLRCLKCAVYGFTLLFVFEMMVKWVKFRILQCKCTKTYLGFVKETFIKSYGLFNECIRLEVLKF